MRLSLPLNIARRTLIWFPRGQSLELVGSWAHISVGARVDVVGCAHLV